MTTEKLRDTIHATPFRPFVLHLADGRRLNVPHPDFIAHVPGGRTAVVLHEDESYNVVDLLLVTDLEVKPPAPAPAQGATLRGD